ncbi:hypothetical protein VNO77_20702 [Canavalia gladiata]|uniref:Uncharacterized protein n=1 Tax=Canavalia gladiata TaxID=3824 RepID=A0AAN9QMP8_CANGL
MGSGDPRGNSGVRNPASATGQKPFVPSYRLFEDLNVFGNTNSGTSSSLSGSMGPGMDKLELITCWLKTRVPQFSRNYNHE